MPSDHKCNNGLVSEAISKYPASCHKRKFWMKPELVEICLPNCMYSSDKKANQPNNKLKIKPAQVARAQA